MEMAWESFPQGSKQALFLIRPAMVMKSRFCFTMTKPACPETGAFAKANCHLISFE